MFGLTTEVVAANRVGETHRRDRWWLAPALTAVGLTAFGIYSIVVAALGSDYIYTGSGARYLSPFYSPDLKSWGLHLSFTYAFFVIWVPLGFRLTCYYYRKAYYRSFFLAPPACAVAGLSRGRYRGETRLPYILMNAHRFFLYIATVVLGFLWYDAVRAFFFRGSDGSLHVGVGLGSLVMLANVVLLWMYTASCHSCRHILGGRLKHFSKHPVRYKSWVIISRLNGKHMQLAWTTLASLAISDFYVMAVSAGWFSDLRFIH